MQMSPIGLFRPLASAITLGRGGGPSTAWSRVLPHSAWSALDYGAGVVAERGDQDCWQCFCLIQADPLLAAAAASATIFAFGMVADS